MNEEELKQIFAELIDANEQAFAVLATAIADVTPGFGKALADRAARARDAFDHPTRDMLLATAVKAVRGK